MVYDSHMYLSVVVPSYNERANIARGVLDELYQYLDQQTYEWELILSDDGSTDGTLIQLQDFAKKDRRIRVLANPHGGKAPTVTAGMLDATGEWRLFTDFDQSTPLSEVENLLAVAERGYGVVIGSREIVGAKREQEPLHRHIMGRGFNIIVQILAVQGILDTQCGFKLFSSRAVETLFPLMRVYGGEQRRADAFTGAFDVELLFLAKRKGFRIREVPVVWHHNETDRVSPLKDSIRMLIDVARIRWAAIRGVYHA